MERERESWSPRERKRDGFSKEYCGMQMAGKVC